MSAKNDPPIDLVKLYEDMDESLMDRFIEGIKKDHGGAPKAAEDDMADVLTNDPSVPGNKIEFTG